MTVDYQDLQINGVHVETYGTPSAAPPLLFVHGGCQGRRGCDVGLIDERGPAPARWTNCTPRRAPALR